jgi:hypothetical protein
MAFAIIDEEYNGLAALYANAGKWVSGVVKVKNTYTNVSGTSNTFTTSGDVIALQTGLWGNFGFVAGDSITITFFSYYPGANGGIKSYTRTITYINGNLMYINSALPSPFTNQVFPTTGQVAGMFIQANKLPQQIDFNFNLCQSGSNSINSIIDGQVNRFKGLVGSAVVATPITMIQQGFASGGLVKDVTITRTADTGTAGITKNFTINFKYFQWGILSNVYYNANTCLTTAIQAKCYSLIGNPNGMETALNGVKEANTGFFGENYNGGANNYAFSSISLLDTLSNPIQQIDYSGTTAFEAIFATPNQLNGSSKYRIGLFFAPLDETIFQNHLESLGNNLLLNAPEIDFLHSATPDVTLYSGLSNLDGVSFDFQNLQFFHSGSVLTVTGDIIPNNAQGYFDALGDGERKLIMFVQVSNYATSGTSNDEVNLICYEDDCFDAPSVGVQYPNIVTEKLFDHNLNDISSSVLANTTTEDDILYQIDFRLPTNITYEGVRCGISARNEITGENFTIENQFISFQIVPFISGIYITNETIPRTFLLPPTTDRNSIILNRNSVLDIVGFAGYTLNYGFLLDWRYWKELSVVNDYFFDVNEDFNGKNKDWKRFFDGDWNLSLDFYVRKNGVDDFNHFVFKPRIYEDDPNVTCAILITAPDGTNPTNFLANEISDIAVDFSWNQLFYESWVQITAENKEGARIGFISSVLDHGNVASNVLKPEPLQTKLQLTGGGTNTLSTYCKIDTNTISSPEISLTYRVYSVPKGSMGYLIQSGKDAKVAYSLQKISSDSVYSGACINVRRSSDNTFQDIGFVGGLLDTASLLTFIGAGDGYVKTIYDQSGGGLNASQATLNKQPRIATAGVISVDPTNGLPAIEFDGVNDFFDLSQIFALTQSFLQSWVCNVNGTYGTISLANSTSDCLLGAISSIDVATVIDGTPVSNGASPELGAQLMTTSHEVSTDDTTVNINGILLNVTNEIPSGSVEYLGKLGAFYSTGFFQELVYWDKDKSAQKVDIENNTIMRYGL